MVCPAMRPCAKISDNVLPRCPGSMFVARELLFAPASSGTVSLFRSWWMESWTRNDDEEVLSWCVAPFDVGAGRQSFPSFLVVSWPWPLLPGLIPLTLRTMRVGQVLLLREVKPEQARLVLAHRKDRAGRARLDLAKALGGKAGTRRLRMHRGRQRQARERPGQTRGRLAGPRGRQAQTTTRMGALRGRQAVLQAGRWRERPK